MPDYPTSFHQLVFAIPLFPFGLQLIRPPESLTSFTYGFPLDSTTNSASRQQLKTIQSSHLSISLVSPTLGLFTELEGLVGSTTEELTLRYVGVRTMVDSTMFLSTPLQAFPKVRLVLNLPRARKTFVGTGAERTLVDDPQSPTVRFLSSLLEAVEVADRDIQERYEIWNVENWDIPGQAHNAERTRLWPKSVLWDMDSEDDLNSEKLEELASPEVSRNAGPSGAGRPAHWDRQTNLRLLGGLINLRLESHKR